MLILCIVVLFLLWNSYKQCVSHQSLWKHCTIDLQRVPFLIILSLLQNYGHMISTLVLHGSASACDRERLFYMIHKYCPNLQYLNSFGVPYLISVNDKVTSFSLTFPSCVSDYITLNNLNERYVMYSPTDCIVQSMEIHNQDLHLFSRSIWQFEIENNVEKGFTTSFQCFVNDVPVGSFTLEDSSVASIYTINLLFPVPEHALSKKYHNLTLSIRCKNQLPFGAGYVVISGIGRVTFLRADNTCKIDPIAPAFVAPSF